MVDRGLGYYKLENTVVFFNFSKTTQIPYTPTSLSGVPLSKQGK